MQMYYVICTQHQIIINSNISNIVLVIKEILAISKVTMLSKGSPPPPPFWYDLRLSVIVKKSNK